MSDNIVSANLAGGDLQMTGTLTGNAAVSVLTLDGMLALGSAGRFTANPAVSLTASTANLILGGDESVGSLAGSGTVSLGSARLTVGSLNTSGSFTGVIAGSGSLLKIGTGTMTISSAQAFTGEAAIAAGAVVLNPGASLAMSNTISVAAGARLDATAVGGLAVSSSQTLAGSGTVSGGLTIANGATLAPGNSPGTLYANSGTVTFGGGGNYNWQILSSTLGAGTGWDYLDGSAGAFLDITASSSNTFNVNLWSLSGLPNTTGDVADFNPNQNYQWLFASAASPITGFAADKFTVNLGSINGTGGFTNTPLNGTFSVALGTSVTGGNANQLYITYVVAAVPEPGTLALAACGLAVVGWRTIRRRRRT